MNIERIERSLRMGPPDEPVYRPREMGLREVSPLRTRIGLTPGARESSRVTAIGILILLALLIAGLVVIGRLRENQPRPAPTTVPALIDVPIDGADQARTGRMPGPVPRDRPVEAWHVAISNPSPSFAVAKGLAIVGDLDGLLRAIDLETRQERWRAQLGGQVLGGMVVVNGTIYVASGDGSMNALDLATGDPRWATLPVASPDATPVVLDGAVYFGRPGEFVAIDADSAAPLWALPIDGSGSTTATDGRLIFVGGQGRGELAAVDIAAREIAWTFPTEHPFVAAPAVRDGIIYVAGQTPTEDRGRVFAVSADGRELWRYPRDTDGPLMSAPAIGEGQVFVGNPWPSTAGDVVAVNRADGSLAWSQRLGGPSGQPSIVGDAVVVTWYGGTKVLDAQSHGVTRYLVPSTGNGHGPLVTGGVIVTVLITDPSDPKESGLWVFAAPDDPHLQAPPSTPTPSVGATPSTGLTKSSRPPLATVESVNRFDERPSLFLSLAAAPDGSLYALDHLNRRIVVFAPDGTPAGEFGSEGTGNGQFDFSEVTPGDQSGSIAIAADGWIAVGDGGNHRVQLLDPDRVFVRTLTGPPDAPFINPCCVAFDAQGRIYVADPGRDDISVFERGGRFIRRFGGPGVGPGQLRRVGTPFVTADGTVFVPNFGNRRVEVFAPDGSYRRRYGTDQDSGVYPDEVSFVGVDGAGRVFMADSVSRLFVFDVEGRALGVIGPDVPGLGRVQLGAFVLSPEGHLRVAILDNDDEGPSRIADLRLVPPLGTAASR
jgi:outer membrane protein assembly factor BamB